MHPITYHTTIRGDDLRSLTTSLLRPDFLAAWHDEQPCRCSLEVCFIGVLNTSEDGPDACTLHTCVAILGYGDKVRHFDITDVVPEHIMRQFEEAIATDDVGLLQDLT